MKRARHRRCDLPANAGGVPGHPTIVMRLSANGRWTNERLFLRKKRQKLRPALAFVGSLPDSGDTPIVFVPECGCKIWADCPACEAVNHAADVFGGATVERVAGFLPKAAGFSTRKRKRSR